MDTVVRLKQMFSVSVSIGKGQGAHASANVKIMKL